MAVEGTVHLPNLPVLAATLDRMRCFFTILFMRSLLKQEQESVLVSFCHDVEPEQHDR